MPILTIIANIEANYHSEKIIKGAMWYATKVFNGSVWHIRQGICKPTRKGLNSIIKFLPAAKAYYSHSVQATRDEVIQAYTSFMALRRAGRTQHQLPGFRNKNSYSPLRYHDQYGFKLNGDLLTISLGTGRKDGVKRLELKLVMRKDLNYKRVINVVITYDKTNGLRAHLVVDVDAGQPLGTKKVAVDLGETYLITAAFDDGKLLRYKGGELKSIRRYWQKVRTCVKPPLPGKKMSKRYTQIAHKESNQIDHHLHLITKHFVMECWQAGADTIIIGDLNGIRERIKYGPRLNQRLHAWPYAKIKYMITYKAALMGMQVIVIDEAYTSQTCYACKKVAKHQRKSRGWYKCSCGWQMQADANGALNILSRYVSSDDRSSGHVASPVVLQSRSFVLDAHKVYETQSASRAV